jgi:hypothetical protein
MSSIVISGDTSGAITLAAPAVSGTNTATLPAATGTVMVSGNMPAFSAYPSSAQSYTNNTFTKITFDTEEFDTNSNFASNRFTPTVAGYYQLNSAVSMNSTAQNYAFISIYKNGSEYKRGGASNATQMYGVSVSSLVYFNGSTDYVEIYALAANNGNGSFQGNGIQTYFNGCMIRAA